MKSIVVILFSILLTSCPSNQEEGGFTTLSKGSLYGSGEEGFKEENIIIQSNEEFKKFLSKLDSTNKISDRFFDKIDFSKNTIIAVFDTVKTSGGFSIEVSNVISKNDGLEIYISKNGPKPTDMVTSAIEQPYHIIKINKTNKEITFK